MTDGWQGIPGSSGSVLAALLRERAAALGVPVTVQVHSWELPGAYGVAAVWGPSNVLFEVVDWSDAVSILDPDGVDVSLADALRYFALRATGRTPAEALAAITPPRLAFRQRLRRHSLRLNYGDCAACGHPWSGHRHPALAEADFEACDECDYQISHGFEDAPSTACRLIRPSRPNWTT